MRFGPGAATALAGGLTMVMLVVSLGGIMGGAVQEEGGAAAGASKTKCGNPSSSVAADTSVAKDDYVKVAEDIAKDDGHGYDYGSYGPTDFDCSGLVWYALHQSGYKVGDTRFNTASEGSALGGAGFKRHDFSKDRLRRGDILVSASHTEIFVGDGKVVTADNNERGEAHGGAPGDQTGKEICIRDFGKWEAMKDVYRLPANDGSAGSKGAATSVSAKSNVDISYLDKWSYSDAASHDPGGDKGKCSDGYGLDQCTQWACVRSHMFGYKEIHNSMGDGRMWVDSAVALGWHKGVIAPGSIMSWAGGAQVPQKEGGSWTADGQYGHVSIVESVDTKAKTLRFSESGQGFGHIHTSSMSYAEIPAGLTFASPPKITKDTAGAAVASGDGGGSSDTETTSCDASDDTDGKVTDASYSGDGNHASPEDAKKIARQLLAQYFPKDHGGDQWSALEKLWTRESSWQWNATNASSGAYGIPQSLPGDKMASMGKDWKDNAGTQIKWGLQYIKQRYGTPKDAWAHSESVGWY